METKTELSVRNPFRSKFMRAAFDDLVNAYLGKTKLLYLPNGEPHRGNSWAGMFWRGYEGTMIGGVWDRASKQTGSYPAWAAGRAVAEAEKRK